MKYEFEVVGKIVGKSRPRLNSYTGVVYTPTNTKDYENLIRQYFLINNKGPIKILESRIRVKIVAYFKIPQSTKKALISDMVENKISPTKKPDIDNIIKIVLDALNNFIIKDDIQVCKLETEKVYTQDEEKLYIEIEEY